MNPLADAEHDKNREYRKARDKNDVGDFVPIHNIIIIQKLC